MASLMNDVTVSLACGTIRGVADGSTETFIGIPYAAPPRGPLRFARPAPVEPWTDVRDCRAAGPNAPQRTRPIPDLDIAPLVGRGWFQGDDYLTLNVWRPTGSRGGLPVMVFIHGGGFVVGGKDASVSNGASFAQDGIVSIAINYRLGVDGFLPIPGIPTNLGLRDQIAALEWVRGNAAVFGGDPGNVTLFGHGAGAVCVACLLTSPLAEGLFERVIVQSGHGSMVRQLPVARRLSRLLAKTLGVTDDRPGYASVPPCDRLFDAMEHAARPSTRIDLRAPDGRDPSFGITRCLPVHGDDVLPLPPQEALRRGAGEGIDVLIGSTADEMNLYLVPKGVRADVGRGLAWLGLRKYERRAWELQKAYLVANDGQTDASGQMMSDLVFRWPSRRFAEDHRGRTFVYEFDWRSTRFNGTLGAAHGIELPFVFDTLAAVTGPEGLVGEDPPQALAARMHSVWADFARIGNVDWPAFRSDRRTVHLFGSNRTIEEAPMPAASFGR